MSNLFTLKVVNHKGATLGFLFKDGVECRRNYDEINARRPGNSTEEARGLAEPVGAQFFEVNDAFGNIGTIDCHDISIVWTTDVAMDLEGNKAHQLLQAHAQASLQRAAAADPLLMGARAPGSTIMMPPKNN